MARRGRARAARVEALLLALVLAGCGRSKDLSDSISTLTSWAATARFAGEAWTAGKIPTPYTRRTLAAAEQAVAEEQDQLAQAPDLASRTRELRQGIAAARSVVARQDRQGIAAPLARIAAVERALRSLGESHESRGGSGS